MAPNIVVSRPTFPTYLLPSISLPFRRRTSSASTSTSTPAASQVPSLSSSPTSSTTDETITPPNSPPPPPSYQDAITTAAVAAAGLSPAKPPPTPRGPAPSSPHLARNQPDTLRCSTCSCDVAFSSQIVSKGFTGRYGRAYLVTPTPHPPGDVNSTTSAAAGPGALANVRIGKCENRQLVTGWHVVADITCALCSAKLGWKYVDAKELSQKYKVGKFILEVERVVPFRSWEDASSADYYRAVSEEEGDDEDSDEAEGAGSEKRKKGKNGKTKKSAGKGAGGRDSGDDTAEGTDKESSEPEEVEIVFDSEDEDDLDDMFSGTWDPEVVARRRSRRVTAARKK